MRGRLICPFVATLYRLDTRAIEVANGYDEDFHTVKPSYPGNIGARTTSRVELAPIELRCQVEIGRWDAQRQTAAGNSPDSTLTLVFHYRELESRSLVDTRTGEPLIRVNDRLASLKRVADGALVQAVREGLYITEVAPGGVGIGGRRNLLIATFEERAQGLTT